MIALYVHLKNSIAIMVLDHSTLGKQIRPNFLRSISLLYKILPTSLGTCKPTFYNFYTSHLRWNSTMRRCFYHTDLGQNAVFHNFAIQIALIQYSGRSKQALAKRLKKFPKSPIRGAGSHFWQAPKSTVSIKINTDIRFNIMAL